MNDDVLGRSLANPPVVEAVAGLEFRPRGLDIVSLIKESELWTPDYPMVSGQIPLAPSRPVGQPGLEFEMHLGAGPQAARVWAASSDQIWLVQSQDDRLLLNWRRLDAAGLYPGYDTSIRPEFVRLLSLLEEQAGSALVPLVAEFSYVNSIDVPEAELHDVFSMFRKPDRALPGSLIAQRYEAVSQSDVDEGTVQVSASIQPAGPPDTTSVTVSAKVFTSRQLVADEGVSLIDRAHDAAKAGFFAIVSDSATDQWGG